ncbi:MAG TPA: hypothetical protein DCZ95_00625 [Verrucomicrobia bacterium]|nr:MAG: hypothetical protein A2X46_05735 [Lentisphaerae bacterium GWF2_57_35]HBA82574.1 hypothetical protein [Verrucomicrobiota bacterium]
MKKHLFWIALIPFLMTKPLQADMSFYLRVQGIEGEATQAQHINWIEAESANYQLQGGGGGVSHSGLTVYKNLDKATPLLMMYACALMPILEVKLHATREINGLEKVVYEVILDNAQVMAVSSSTQTNTASSYEGITFNYQQIEWTYYLYDAFGNVTGSTTGNAVVSP